MALEGIFPPGSPRYVGVPKNWKRNYVWPEYARGAEAEKGVGAPKFVAGDMYFVRFGEQWRSSGPSIF